jgi:hypothetical protein
LASLYDFDVVDDDEDLSQADKVLSMAYLDRSEQDDEDEHSLSPTKASRNNTKDSSSLYSRSVDGFDTPARAQQYRSMISSRSSMQIDRGTRDQLQKARSRHRKRRYDILSDLLLASGDYLQLESGQVKAFLPMLAKLLVPNSDKKEASHASQLSAQHGQRPHSNSSNTSSNLAAMDNQEKTILQRSGISGANVNGFTNSEEMVHLELDDIEYLRPFLESLTPGAGLRCVALLLLQYLLLHSRQTGYDARVRHAIKTLGVLVLVHDMQHDPVDVYIDDELKKPSSSPRTRRHRGHLKTSHPDLVVLATRKFESLEHFIAAKLIVLSREQQAHKVHRGARSAGARSSQTQQTPASKGLTREQWMRGIKIGGTAMAAGTLFAITGGLAAPGIAAGVAAIAGGTAVTAAAAAVLTSTAAVTTIFGVGGGGLAAYKMQRRTQGLTEFEFRKETGKASREKEGQIDTVDAELFSTICISGWLRDKFDFQRPWGVSPSRPELTDRQELLERFYTIHSPSHISRCAKILDHWKGEEKDLWGLLRQKYGQDPDHLFPLEKGPRLHASLTLEQKEVIDQLFVELGYTPKSLDEIKTQPTPFERIRKGWNKQAAGPRRDENLSTSHIPVGPAHRSLADSLQSPESVETYVGSRAEVTSSGFESFSTALSMLPPDKRSDESTEKVELPRHIATVWDYPSIYGGEQYTVQWESELLTELCDSVNDLARDLVSGGTAQILKHTALSTLISAFAWPYALVNAANMIDGTWTLAVERSDEAGRELARSLLLSRAGHRPVTLVGFSFGARAIYSCLKELARLQEKWEDFCEDEDSSRSGKVLQNQSVADLELDESNKDYFRYMREPASIVEDVVLMGLPNHLSLSSWKACRQVVAGRLINCFSQKDLILSLMFQFKRLGLKPVCGTCPVNVPGVENIDVSDLVSGHQDYTLVLGDILKRVRHCQPFRSRHTRIFVPEVAASSM